MANPPPSPNVAFRLKACRRHIALVEADPVRQGVSRRSIQALGARVTILPSWARLYRRVQSFAFDLIVFGHQADLAKGPGPSDPSPPAPAETPILMLGKRSAVLRTKAGHEPLAWAASCRRYEHGRPHASSAPSAASDYSSDCFRTVIVEP
jgi:hypothetical protein